MVPDDTSKFLEPMLMAAKRFTWGGGRVEASPVDETLVLLLIITLSASY